MITAIIAALLLATTSLLFAVIGTSNSWRVTQYLDVVCNVAVGAHFALILGIGLRNKARVSVDFYDTLSSFALAYSAVLVILAYYTGPRDRELSLHRFAQAVWVLCMACGTAKASGRYVDPVNMSFLLAGICLALFWLLPNLHFRLLYRRRVVARPFVPVK